MSPARFTKTIEVFSVCLGSLLLLIAADSFAQAAEPLRTVYYDDFAPYSYKEDGKTKGLLIDIFNEVLGNGMGLELIHESYPWARAQHMVEVGEADAFTTVSTPERLSYADMTEASVVDVDFSIFISMKSLRYNEMSKAKSLKDFRPLMLCQYMGSGWSKFNLVQYNVRWMKDTDLILSMLAEGRCDAMVDVSLSIQHLVKKGGYGDAIMKLPLLVDSLSFKFFLGKKSVYNKILKDIDEHLKQANGNGTIENIFLQYQ